jgi:hypothetical protein
MQIGAKGIENMLITSICDYGVEKKSRFEETQICKISFHFV